MVLFGGGSFVVRLPEHRSFNDSGQIPGNYRESAVVTGSNDVDEIYHQMAAIRRERHEHVSESVAGAEAVIDWGRYTWMYPWIALGAAAAVGYLVYTGRHPKVRASDARPADGALAAEPVAGASADGQERSRIGWSILLANWDFLLPVAVRAGQNYTLHWLEQIQPTRTVSPSGLSPSARGAERPNGPIDPVRD